jgi:trehalose-6-phosphate synthase
MPIEERRSRMRLLRDVIRTYNVQVWAESFLTAELTSDPLTAAEEERAPAAEYPDVSMIASSEGRHIA